MEDKSYQNSLSAASRILAIMGISIFLLYTGKSLFIPLSFGLLVAIVAYPACKWLEQRRWPRSLAILSILLAVAVLFAGLLALLFYEANLFLDNLPAVSEKLNQYSNAIRFWIDSTFRVTREVQDDLLEKMAANFEENISSLLSNAISATGSTAIMLFLIPVFAALFLFHRRTFVYFLESLVGAGYKDKLQVIVRESIISYYKFVKGTCFVYCIVGVLNSLGLLALGIQHAFLFGMVTAFMTIIPYVGIIMSASLPVAVALITKDSVWYAIGVVSVFSFVQYLEANVIFPRIVGQQLNLSTWAVVVAMIVGTLLWGIPGMILFTPFAAILKIFSDHMKELEAVNILLNRNASPKEE